MINESLLQSCGEYHSQTNSKTNTRPRNNWNSRPVFSQTTKKACTTREARTRSRRVSDVSSHKTFTISPKKKFKRLNVFHSTINQSLLQSCGQYHSQTNTETNTRPQRQLELKTSVLIGNKEGLHHTLSADSVRAGASVSGSAGGG